VLLDREQLETFARIVDEGSFERAAASLNLTRGAVSQRIKALEESVAAVLLVREKPVVPTGAGGILLRHVRALRLLEDEALAELLPSAKERAPVPLAIAVDADSLATWFPRILWPLLLKRRIALEVIADDQDNTLTRLARGEVLGCVSPQCKASAGFVAEPLGAMEYRCMATREFARQHFPHGLSLASVLGAPAVLFNRKDSLHDEFLAVLFGFRVEGHPRHYLPATGTLLDGVRAGIGYGLVPSVQLQAMQDRVEREQLIDLAPEQPVLIDLYWHHWEFEPPLLAEITQGVIDEAARALDRASAIQARSAPR